MPDREDAELVVAVREGSELAFADLYDRYSDRIHDFCHSILRDRHEAGDAMQQTFLMAIENIGKLREPEKLKAWLYAIAKNDCYHRIRKRQRESPTESFEEVVPTTSQPERVAEQDDLQEVVWSAAAGLAVRDRTLLDLHLRQGLDGQELADAMGVKPSQVYVLMSRLKDQVERSLGALLVARAGRRDCPELDELLSTWDGLLTPLIRKRIARHVDNCEICDERRRQLASPLALLSAVAVVPAPSLLRGVFVERARAQKFGRPVARRREIAHQTSFDRRGFPKEGSINTPAIVAIAAALVIAVGVVVGAFSISSPRAQPVVSTSSTHQSEVTTTSTQHTGTKTTTSTQQSKVTTTTDPASASTLPTTSHGTKSAPPVVPGGLQKISVPNVVGDTQQSACAALVSSDLVCGTESAQSSSTTASGLVLGSSPAAGQGVAPASSVNLIVSSGLPMVVVPNVLEESAGTAQSQLEQLGLAVAETSTLTCGGTPSGDVLSQSPSAGTSVPENSLVNLTICQYSLTAMVGG
jgi:RNA polymerase sigma factor (sigma-70 family)